MKKIKRCREGECEHFSRFSRCEKYHVHEVGGGKCPFGESEGENLVHWDVLENLDEINDYIRKTDGLHDPEQIISTINTGSSGGAVYVVVWREVTE